MDSIHLMVGSLKACHYETKHLSIRLWERNQKLGGCYRERWHPAIL